MTKEDQKIPKVGLLDLHLLIASSQQAGDLQEETALLIDLHQDGTTLNTMRRHCCILQLSIIGLMTNATYLRELRMKLRRLLT